MKKVVWKIHLRSNPKKVFDLLATPEGRRKFWAKEAMEENGKIYFVFPNGQVYQSEIIYSNPNQELHLDYFKSLVKFRLNPLKNGGTDLTLTNENIPDTDFDEVNAGWVSVLMNLKAVADFQYDLRNHDPHRTWDEGYIDN